MSNERSFSDEDRFETADALTLMGHDRDCEHRRGEQACGCAERKGAVLHAGCGGWFIDGICNGCDAEGP